MYINFSGIERIPVGRHIAFVEECLGILRPFRRKASGCWAVQLLHKMRSLAAQRSDKPDKHSQHIQRNPRHYFFLLENHETSWKSFTMFWLILQLLSVQEKTKTATILIRGGAQQFIDEAARSLNDSLMTLVIVVICCDVRVNPGTQRTQRSVWSSCVTWESWDIMSQLWQMI